MIFSIKIAFNRPVSKKCVSDHFHDPAPMFVLVDYVSKLVVSLSTLPILILFFLNNQVERKKKNKDHWH